MNNVKKSFILNVITVILVIIMIIFMLLGIHFMPKNDLLILSTKFENFKFYTIDSNILLCLSSLLLAIYEYKLLKKKIKVISKNIYIFKMVGVSAISLTFIVTLFFLSPLYGFYGMYNNVNLFFHFVIPIIGFISYFFYEKHDNEYKYAYYGIIPMLLYAIFYISNILIHLDEGISFKYDFYGFLQGNINNIYFAIPIIFVVGYLLSLLTICLNKKLAK